MFSTAVTRGKNFTAEQKFRELKKRIFRSMSLEEKLSGSKSPMKNLSHIDLTFVVKLLNRTSL